MVQRTNSPIDDSTPFQEPDFEQPEQVPANDFAKFGKNKKRYSELTQYLEGRKQQYREYLPDGTPVAKLSDTELGMWWKCAATMIREFDLLVQMIEQNKAADEMEKKARGQ